MRRHKYTAWIMLGALLLLIGGAMGTIAWLETGPTSPTADGKHSTARAGQSKTGLSSLDAAAEPITPITNGDGASYGTNSGSGNAHETGEPSGDDVGKKPGPDSGDENKTATPATDPNATAGATVTNGTSTANRAAADDNRRNNRRNRPRRGSASDGKEFRRYSVPNELLSRKPTILSRPEFTRPAGTSAANGPLGLLGSYFEAQVNPATAKAELLPPAQWGSFPRLFSRIDPEINFAHTAAFNLGAEFEQFMVLWDGFLAIEEPGAYAFFVGHDGDIRMFVNDQQVFADNDTGIYLELFFTVELAAGESPVQITYFHKHGNAQVRLRYFTPTELAILQAMDKFENGPILHGAGEGETPAMLADFYYGTPEFADLILAANPDAVSHPDQVIEPGTPIVVPPIPVERAPKEPRIVPETMFRPADEAVGALPPEIFAVSPASAAVGDKVEIRGENFGPIFDDVRVEFAGQPAAILEAAPDRLLVEVPIGAETGPIVIHQSPMRSNAVDFAVTNIFGLLAAFYDLTNEPNGVIPAGGTAGDIHVTSAVTFGSRTEIDSALRGRPLGIEMAGELGIAVAGTYEISLSADEFARILIDDLPLIERPSGTPAGPVTVTRFFAEGRFPIKIEWVDMSEAAHLDVKLKRIDGEHPDAAAWRVRRALLFPPPLPSTPPEISAVEYTNPFGVAEGEMFAIVVTGIPATGEGVGVFVDGLLALAQVPVFGEGNGEPVPPPQAGAVRLLVTVPMGVDFGRVTVRYAFLTSAPATVPLRDVGLFGVYYDFPEESLDNQWPTGFPDERPISFMRRDPEIFLEGTGEFDLPFVAETFGVVWTGTIRIEQPGTYKFVLGADDGQSLAIAGTMVIDDGTVKYYREIEGTIELQPGEYPIEVRFWENRRHEVVKLFWIVPGTTEKTKVPRRVLRMPPDWTARYTAWQATLSGGTEPPPGGGEEAGGE